jgi:hypothetical protein
MCYLPPFRGIVLIYSMLEDYSRLYFLKED